MKPGGSIFSFRLWPFWVVLNSPSAESADDPRGDGWTDHLYHFGISWGRGRRRGMQGYGETPLAAIANCVLRSGRGNVSRENNPGWISDYDVGPFRVEFSYTFDLDRRVWRVYFYPPSRFFYWIVTGPPSFSKRAAIINFILANLGKRSFK